MLIYGCKQTTDTQPDKGRKINMFLSGKDLFIYKAKKASEIIVAAIVIGIALISFSAMFLAWC